MHFWSRVPSVSLFVATVAVASPSLGTDFFGPKTFTLASGQPQELIETIRVLPDAMCGGKAAFLLRVENGGVDPATRITSGEILWNGSAVAVESDFRKHATTLDKAVTVTPENQLIVRLKGGKPGAYVRLSLTRHIEDAAIPSETFRVLGGQTVATRHFTISDPWRTHVVTIVNGDAAGAQRAKSGSITLNGVELVGERELNARADFVRAVVQLQSANTLSVTVRGDPGDHLTISMTRLFDDAACLLGVNILTPAEGSTLNTSGILVRGTATGKPGLGITVNEVPAIVALDHAGTEADPYEWFAEIPATTGTTEISATATSHDGFTRSTKRTVNFAPPTEFVRLEPSSHTGVVPLHVVFHLSTHTNSLPSRYDFDLDGDGTFESGGNEVPEEIRFRYENPRVYAPAVRVLLEDGRTLTFGSLVAVQSFQTMDLILRDVWSRFTRELAAGNVDRALLDLAPSVREKYRAPLELIRPNLPRYARSVADIRTAEFEPQVARYLIVRDEEGRPFAYHLYFVRCSDGLWRVLQF